MMDGLVVRLWCLIMYGYVCGCVVLWVCLVCVCWFLVWVIVLCVDDWWRCGFLCLGSGVMYILCICWVLLIGSLVVCVWVVWCVGCWLLNRLWVNWCLVLCVVWLILFLVYLCGMVWLWLYVILFGCLCCVVVICYLFLLVYWGVGRYGVLGWWVWLVCCGGWGRLVMWLVCWRMCCMNVWCMWSLVGLWLWWLICCSFFWWDWVFVVNRLFWWWCWESVFDRWWLMWLYGFVWVLVLYVCVGVCMGGLVCFLFWCLFGWYCWGLIVGVWNSGVCCWLVWFFGWFGLIDEFVYMFLGLWWFLIFGWLWYWFVLLWWRSCWFVWCEWMFVCFWVCLFWFIV